MFDWFDRNAIKQGFILMLRRFAQIDGIIDEIYDNLGALSDGINELSDTGVVNFDYDSTTHYLRSTNRAITIDNSGYITFGRVVSNSENNEE